MLGAKASNGLALASGYGLCFIKISKSVFFDIFAIKH